MSLKSRPTVDQGSSPSQPGGRRDCSIADALGILGDRWALLVVRECAYGTHRFNEIQRHTGAPRDILTNRLRGLEAAGIVRREPYSAHPPRHEYLLTESGEELLPVLLALREWGERRLHEGEAPVSPVWHTCGAELHVETVCRGCQGTIRAEELRYAEI